MKFHAVCTRPPNRSLLLIAVLLFSPFLSLTAAQAATLGVVTAIDRTAGKLAIDGQTYRVDSFSEVKQTAASGAEEVAAWYSLNVGDYVIFDAGAGRIKSLRREAADSLDVPAQRPLDLGSVAPAER
ncbi:MAG: hypothetical protein RIC38_11665 [Chromatocurvus sp.]